MSQENPRRWRWYVDSAGAAICVGMTLIFALGGIAPLLRQRAAFAHHQASLAVQRQIASELAESLDSHEARLSAVRDMLTLSPFQLESSASINERIALVAGLARDCGLKIDEIQIGSSTRGLWYETVAIHLAGVGNYRTCATLLHRLRQSFPDTTVSSLRLSGDPGDPRAVAHFCVDLLWHAAPDVRPRTDG